MYNGIVSRGDIFLVQLPETNNSQQSGKRPFILTSNYLCNKYSTILTGIPLTSKLDKKPLPTHVTLGLECGLLRNSIALAEQIMPVDRYLLIEKVGQCTDEAMQQIERAIQIQNGINEVINYKYLTDLIKRIRETENFIQEYNYLPRINAIINECQSLYFDLKLYCTKYNINYHELVYKELSQYIRYKNKGDVVNA
jgi:mRNA interferase MazF